MKRIFLFVALSFLSCTVFGVEYYVDAQAGNDAADGRSVQTAWKTLRAVNQAKLSPGDTVRFKRGDQWRGQLRPQSGQPDQPITYTSYGQGQQKPRLLGSVSLNDPNDWVLLEENLWSTRPDEFETGTEIESFRSLRWGHHTEAGAQVNFKNISDENGYSIVCQSSGTARNHIQLIVSGFPVEATRHYLFRFKAKSTQAFTIPAIGFSEPGSPWGSLGVVLRQSSDIQTDWTDCFALLRCNRTHDKARFTLSLGSVLPAGAELQLVPISVHEVSLKSSGIDSDVGNIILDGTKAGFKKWTRSDLTHEDDFVYNMKENTVLFRSSINPATKYQSIEAALHHHVVDHSHCQHVIFDDLDIRYGAAHGFGGTNARNCTYRNLDISWIGGADQYKEGAAGRRVRFGNGIEFWSDAENCLVEHCRLWEIYDAALTNQGSGINTERNITYRNNQIWNCEYSFEYWNRGPESITDNIIFENNICRDAGFGWGHVQRPDKNGRHVMIYNNEAKTTNLIIRKNIFENATESLVRIDSDFRPGLIMDHNLYWQDNPGLLFRWLNKAEFNENELIKYQNETGLDKNSKRKK